MDFRMNFSTAIVLQFLFIWVAFWMMIPSHEKKNSLNISNRYQVQTRSWFTLWFPFILDHYDKEVAFLADTNQLLNFLIKLNQRIMLPADVIWIDFKYNFLTKTFPKNWVGNQRFYVLILTTAYFFFRNKTFLFFKIKSWNFQKLSEKEFRET